MKRTHYIVQTERTLFIRKGESFGYTSMVGAENATRFTLPEAREIYKLEARLAGRDTPRRFPRIIKVTTEYKTITKHRR